MKPADTIYRFALQSDGVEVEDLGVMSLRDDAEATAFGERVARDLAAGPAQPPGAALAIIARSRTVRSIPVGTGVASGGSVQS